MAETFWSDDIYAGDVRLRIRFAQDDGDPNDRLTVDATWPSARSRRIVRIMSSTYRQTYGLDSAIAVAQAATDRIAALIRRGLYTPTEARHEQHRS